MGRSGPSGFEYPGTSPTPSIQVLAHLKIEDIYKKDLASRYEGNTATPFPNPNHVILTTESSQSQAFTCESVQSEFS